MTSATIDKKQGETGVSSLLLRVELRDEGVIFDSLLVILKLSHIVRRTT